MKGEPLKNKNILSREVRLMEAYLLGVACGWCRGRGQSRGGVLCRACAASGRSRYGRALQKAATRGLAGIGG